MRNPQRAVNTNTTCRDKEVWYLIRLNKSYLSRNRL